MDVDPVVGEEIGRADHQRDGQEVAIFEIQCVGQRRRQRMDAARQLAHRRGRDDVIGADHPLALGAGRGEAPAPAIPAELLECMAHQYGVAALDHLVARGLPHHAGATARIAEAFQQRLGFHAVIGALVQPQRALEAIEHRLAEAEPLDALCGPIGGDFVAGHAPHLLGVGLEEDREELLAELVDRPVLEAASVLPGEQLPAQIARHAQRRAEHAEVPQRLERTQRIAVELALIIDAAHPRALDEIVRQDLVPEIDHLARLREESVAADVESEAVVLDGAADAADIDGILLDHRHALAGLCQEIGSGQAGRACADDGNIDAVLLLGGHGLLPRLLVRNARGGII